jgi:hypothetical protein
LKSNADTSIASSGLFKLSNIGLELESSLFRKSYVGSLEHSMKFALA